MLVLSTLLGNLSYQQFIARMYIQQNALIHIFLMQGIKIHREMHVSSHRTRTRAVQHKCLPQLACINPTPLLFQKIVVNSKNVSEI